MSHSTKENYWQPVKVKTIADDVVDSIVEAATRGFILPGDRIVEKEIAEKMQVSRMPVREALRVLESQGIVVSEPFKGIRLAPVSEQRLNELIDVRVVLELYAIRTLINQKGHLVAENIDLFKQKIEQMKKAALLKNNYLFSLSDVDFHRTICILSGNITLTSLWENVAKQLTIVIGISTLGKPMEEIIHEHEILLDKIIIGDLPQLEKEFEEHICAQTKRVDFSTIIDNKRKNDKTR